MGDEPRKELKNLGDHIDDIARRKAEAAKARFRGSNPTAEKPRDVFQASCQKIGAAFEPLGFKFGKSHPDLKRRVGDWTHWIAFGTSHHNIAGQHVELTTYAQLHNERLKQWRKVQPHYAKDKFLQYFGGGQLGNLLPEKTWFKWELADTSSRDQVIEDVVATIKRVAFPYFAMVDEFEAACMRLERGEVAEVDPTNTIEFFLAHDRKDAAIRYANGFIKTKPDIRSKVDSFVSQFRLNGLPHHGPRGTGWAQEFAHLSVLYDLDL